MWFYKTSEYVPDSRCNHDGIEQKDFEVIVQQSLAGVFELPLLHLNWLDAIVDSEIVSPYISNLNISKQIAVLGH